MRSKILGLVCVVLSTLVTTNATASTTVDKVYRFRPGLHLSHQRPLSNKEIRTLLSGLSFWTGLSDICINTRGDIDLGDRTRFVNGSVIARQLLIAAVDSRDSFTIQSSNQSSTVAFAQIEATERYASGDGVHHNGWILRVDFADFAELRGDNRALAAFDPAINVLHELTHGVLGYFDPLEPDDELGQCERYINQIRNELELPRRAYYYPRSPDGKTTNSERKLTFRRPESGGELSVVFSLEKVFDLSKAKSRSANQSDLLAQRRASDFSKK